MKKSVMEVNAKLQKDLLDMISDAAENLDEVCEEVSEIIAEEGAEAIGQANLLLYCAEADYAMQVARAATFDAVHSDMPADMAKEVVNAAAELGLTAEALTEAFSEGLDEALDEADQVLEVAMDELVGDDDEGDEDCEEGGVDLDYIAQVLIDAGLCKGGDEITIEISPDEGDDDDDEDWGEPDEDDPETAAFTAAFEEIEVCLADAGLLKNGQVMTLGINRGGAKD